MSISKVVKRTFKANVPSGETLRKVAIFSCSQAGWRVHGEARRGQAASQLENQRPAIGWKRAHCKSECVEVFGRSSSVNSFSSEFDTGQPPGWSRIELKFKLSSAPFVLSSIGTSVCLSVRPARDLSSGTSSGVGCRRPSPTSQRKKKLKGENEAAAPAAAAVTEERQRLRTEERTGARGS